MKMVPSSPIAGLGKEDDRSVVRAFFEWLVNQLPADEREPYLTAQSVAAEELWGVEDFKAMSVYKSEL